MLIDTSGKVPYLLGVLLTSLLFQLAVKVSSCGIPWKIGTFKLVTVTSLCQNTKF